MQWSQATHRIVNISRTANAMDVLKNNALPLYVSQKKKVKMDAVVITSTPTLCILDDVS